MTLAKKHTGPYEYRERADTDTIMRVKGSTVARNLSGERWRATIVQRSLKDLERYSVSATDGEVGHVVDSLLDDQHWAVRYLVVEAGSFFNGRRVLISPISFRKVDWATQQFHLALTMGKVNASPNIDTDKPVSRQHEREYNRYYGYHGRPAESQPSPASRGAPVGGANPPRTTSFGWLTAPKFGSAGGGGAELEPGPERD